jgi:hypothetical protein
MSNLAPHTTLLAARHPPPLEIEAESRPAPVTDAGVLVVIDQATERAIPRTYLYFIPRVGSERGRRLRLSHPGEKKVAPDLTR